MSGKPIKGRAIDHIVEKQMRQWELRRSEEAMRETRAKLAGREIDYITISREPGSSGGEIARILSELLGWRKFDREIIDQMSSNMNVHRDMLDGIEERGGGWLKDSLSFGEQSIGPDKYYRHLVRVLLIVARYGQAVIAGRAAGLVLPREKGLSVRITAPFAMRSQRYAELFDVGIEEARILVEKADKSQRAFVKQFLNKDICDPTHYDMVFSTEKLSPESVAKLISRALDQRHAAEAI